jgi:hypothetical protein
VAANNSSVLALSFYQVELVPLIGSPQTFLDLSYLAVED